MLAGVGRRAAMARQEERPQLCTDSAAQPCPLLSASAARPCDSCTAPAAMYALPYDGSASAAFR